MILFKQAHQLSAYLRQQQENGNSIGFVPTMGALHRGHTTLLAKAKKDAEIAVCSIFVNPTQFNNPTDFERYPVTLEKDMAKLIGAACDVLFLPSVAEIYPAGYIPKSYDLGELETILEGRFRPGHFQGVCQVVDRLLAIVHPDRIYFGQKDYQQCQVIKRLLTLTGREQMEMITVPTIREEDGLAMSSRNLRLDETQRKKAPIIYKVLQMAREELNHSPREQITERAVQSLTENGFSVDYFEIRDARTLLPPANGNTPQVVLVAASLDDIRLIDNLPLN